jgi:hypothetical protein
VPALSGDGAAGALLVAPSRRTAVGRPSSVESSDEEEISMMLTLFLLFAAGVRGGGLVRTRLGEPAGRDMVTRRRAWRG